MKNKLSWVTSTTASNKPVIKWSGSKRLQADKIVSYFPAFDVYYEPFLGGGSVLSEANPRKAICGDICEPLVEFWKLLQTDARSLIANYAENWYRLQKEGYTYYYAVRERFNAKPNPNDLLFLSRTCVNGLIRFNKKGKFNNSLHHTRRGIHPARMTIIILDWAARVKDYEFVSGDYREISKTVSERDFVYLDPPYFNTKGRYYGRIDFKEFLEYLHLLNRRSIKYALSFDGTRGDWQYLADIPSELYKHHFLIDSGNSTFRKVIDRKVEGVKESLYINYEPCVPKDLGKYSSNTASRIAGNSSARSVSANQSE